MINDNGNVLYDLAQAMTAGDRHLTATALRRLAQKGYTSLAEVDQVSDWELLAIPGIGLGLLGAIRRLTRSDWQPPSRQAVKTAERFLYATRLALRFWSVEDLEATIQGAGPAVVGSTPAETRLTIEAFAGAVREALPHHESDELIQIVQRVRVLASHGGKSKRIYDRA